MSWTYKTQYSITTVLTPPSTPSPTPLGTTTAPAPHPDTAGFQGTKEWESWGVAGPVWGGKVSARKIAASAWQRYQNNTKPNQHHARHRKRQRDHTDHHHSSKMLKNQYGYTTAKPETKTNNRQTPNDLDGLLSRLISKGMIQVPVKVEATPKTTPDKNLIKTVDLEDPVSLRVAQPGLVAQLYAGTQCSNCSTRFPPTQTARYSQHLDWHFRQNGRDRLAIRSTQSRPWHYAAKDWLQYEEVEDLDKREKSWFVLKRANEVEEEVKEVPSTVAGALADDNCWVCGDKFGMFYNDDDDEWHLKNCMRHGDKNFHPACLESYKKSPAKHERRQYDEVKGRNKNELQQSS